MNSIYILIVVLSFGAPQRPAAFTQEFFSLKACQQAAQHVRNSGASVALAVCTEK